MCIVFLAMSFIAKNLSGYMLVYLMMLGIFFGPYGISKLPEDYVLSIKQTLQNITGSEGKLFFVRNLNLMHILHCFLRLVIHNLS